MANLTFSGNLTEFTASFIDNFQGNFPDPYAFLNSDGLRFFKSFPYSSRLEGFGLKPPTEGNVFLTGVVNSFLLQELELSPTNLVDHFVIDDILLFAEDLFTLITRADGVSYGIFEQDVFAQKLSAFDFNVTGSDADDIVVANRWLTFASNDRFSLGAGDDLVDAGAGKDRINGGDGNDKLLGGKGRDTVLGETGNDILKGGGGNDVLKGGAGSDTLFGNGGRDVLNGDGGRNTLVGGNGADTFVFAARSHTTVRDFELGKDTLRLSDDLWIGQRSVQEVVEKWGKVTKFGITLEFKDADTLRLKGLDDLDLLADDILTF